MRAFALPAALFAIPCLSCQLATGLDELYVTSASGGGGATSTNNTGGTEPTAGAGAVPMPTGGEGTGASGAGSTDGGAGDGGASTTTGMGGAENNPTTPCVVAGQFVDCGLYEACCLNVESAELDHCDPEECGKQEYPLVCNAQADCEEGICCAYVDQFGELEGVFCEPSCNAPSRVICETEADCGGQICEPLFDPNFAPDYVDLYRMCP